MAFIIKILVLFDLFLLIFITYVFLDKLRGHTYKGKGIPVT